MTKQAVVIAVRCRMCTGGGYSNRVGEALKARNSEVFLYIRYMAAKEL
jgi:hypothetical protein